MFPATLQVHVTYSHLGIPDRSFPSASPEPYLSFSMLLNMGARSQLCHLSFSVCDCDAGHLAVHSFLCFIGFPSIYPRNVGLTCYYVTLGLLKDFCWHTNRHIGKTLPVQLQITFQFSTAVDYAHY